MALVNKADSDRDTIDEYMEELDALHQKQLAMIQTVEEVSRPTFLSHWNDDFAYSYVAFIIATNRA